MSDKLPDIGFHIVTPADLPAVKEIVAAIEAGCKERAAAEQPVDRRDPVGLKNQLQNAQWFLGELNRDYEAAKGLLAEAEDKVKTIQKLIKLCEKNAKTMPAYKRNLEDAQARLPKAEQEVAQAQRYLANMKRRLEGQRQGIEEFKKFTPRKEWKTNLELIEDYREERSLLDSLRRW